MQGGLTPKQRKFAEGIISGLNPLDAYERAGYKVQNRSTASREAQRMLSNPKITPIIEAGQKRALETAIWSREKATEALIEMVEVGRKAIREAGCLDRDNAQGVFGAVDRLNELCLENKAQETESQIQTAIPTDRPIFIQGNGFGFSGFDDAEYVVSEGSTIISRTAFDRLGIEHDPRYQNTPILSFGREMVDESCPV